MPTQTHATDLIPDVEAYIRDRAGERVPSDELREFFADRLAPEYLIAVEDESGSGDFAQGTAWPTGRTGRLDYKPLTMACQMLRDRGLIREVLPHGYLWAGAR